MNRIFLIIVALVVVAGFGALIFQSRPTPLPSPQLLPPQSAKEQNILVSEPRPGAVLGLEFMISGLARTFESNVVYEVRTKDNRVLAKGFTTAFAPDVGQFGPFNIPVKIPGSLLSGSVQAVVEAFDYSAKDGTKIDAYPVEVTIDPGAKITTLLRVFFNHFGRDPEISCNVVFPVNRAVPYTTAPARAAIEELLKGPTALEKEQGYSTSIPNGVRINSLQIANGVARIDFNDAIDQGIGGSCRVSAIRAQIEETLKQFPTVKNVVISRNGDYEAVLQP